MNAHNSLLSACLISLSLLAGAPASAEPGATDKAAAKPAAAEAKSDALSKLPGKYKYAGPKEEKQKISDMIDKILFTLDDSMRMPAKERLEFKTHVAEWVDIKQSGSKYTIHHEGRKPDVLSLEGPTSGMDPEGNPAELRLTQEGGKLIHQIKTAEGTRLITYIPQSDGSLKLNVELSSARLATPMKWSLTYRKGK